MRSGLPAKEQQDPQGADYIPDASSSNCVLMLVLNIKHVTLADAEATTSGPLGGSHILTYALCKGKADTPTRFNETLPEEPKTVKTSIKGENRKVPQMFLLSILISIITISATCPPRNSILAHTPENLGKSRMTGRKKAS